MPDQRKVIKPQQFKTGIKPPVFLCLKITFPNKHYCLTDGQTAFSMA